MTDRRSEFMRAKWQDPVYREHIRECLRRPRNKQPARAEQMRAKWQDPDFRARMAKQRGQQPPRHPPGDVWATLTDQQWADYRVLRRHRIPIEEALRMIGAVTSS